MKFPIFAFQLSRVTCDVQSVNITVSSHSNFTRHSVYHKFVGPMREHVCECICCIRRKYGISPRLLSSHHEWQERNVRGVKYSCTSNSLSWRKIINLKWNITEHNLINGSQQQQQQNQSSFSLSSSLSLAASLSSASAVSARTHRQFLFVVPI